MRLFFALVGAVAAVMAALTVEQFYRISRAPDRLDDRTAPALLFQSDINIRLTRENAQRGDPQISLSWNNRNDLDLHCVDPNGDQIWYQNRTSQSGGELDVDMNVRPESDTPIENIYWTPGNAPRGQYVVYVDHFRNHGASDPTPYTVRVVKEGKISTYEGSLSRGERRQRVVAFMVDDPRAGLSAFQRDFWTPLWVVSLWMGLIGAAMTFLLRVAQKPWNRDPALLRASPLLGGLAGGFLTGAIAGAIGQTLYFFTVGTWMGFVAPRYMGLMMGGALLGYSLSHFIPHLRLTPARWAGFLGGALAAYLFYWLIANMGSLEARLGAASALGFLIGLMIKIPIEAEEEFEEAVVETDMLPERMPAAVGARKLGPPNRLRRS